MTEEDEAAFDEFLAARSTALLRTAILVCGASRHDAEDLVQNALEKSPDLAIELRMSPDHVDVDTELKKIAEALRPSP
jgi:hypothetical protein